MVNVGITRLPSAVVKVHRSRHEYMTLSCKPLARPKMVLSVLFLVNPISSLYPVGVTSSENGGMEGHECNKGVGEAAKGLQANRQRPSRGARINNHNEISKDDILSMS